MDRVGHYKYLKYQENVQGDTRNLATHLRGIHGVTGMGQQKLICNQQGCSKTFTLMNSLLKHIRRFHRPSLELADVAVGIHADPVVIG